MKRVFISIIILQLFGMIAVAQSFSLKSEDVKGAVNVKFTANVFGCQGQNLSPQLRWEGAPAVTKYYAVTIFDKDAPRAGGFWHWLVYNIPSSVTMLKPGASNALPHGAISGLNDAGSFGYVGPCPPKGPRHEYIVTLYALKAKLPEAKEAKPQQLATQIKKNSIAKASFSFFYQR